MTDGTSMSVNNFGASFQKFLDQVTTSTPVEESFLKVSYAYISHKIPKPFLSSFKNLKNQTILISK